MCHLLAAYWNLSPTCCMLATDNTEFHLDMHVLSKHVALENGRIPISTTEIR